MCVDCLCTQLFLHVKRVSFLFSERETVKLNIIPIWPTNIYFFVSCARLQHVYPLYFATIGDACRVGDRTFQKYYPSIFFLVIVAQNVSLLSRSRGDPSTCTAAAKCSPPPLPQLPAPLPHTGGLVTCVGCAALSGRRGSKVFKSSGVPCAPVKLTHVKARHTTCKRCC